MKFSNCSTKVKKQLFQAFCTNFYCTHLWWSYSKETLRKTTVAYNNSLRFLLGYQRFCSASGMFVECNLDNFATIRRRYIYNFMCRTRTSSNCIIQTLVKHQCYVATPSVMEWGRSLYAGERLETFQWLHCADLTVCFSQFVLCMFACLCVFCVFFSFFYGPFGVPELKCTYLLTYLLMNRRSSGTPT